MPEISVLMGGYNCADTLAEAVGCLLRQSVSDWELLLCDDGSTDGTYAVAQKLALSDPRIHLLKNEKNLGLPKTLNRCAALAKAPYLARMDGDDRCDPSRFEKELAVIRRGQYAVVSCGMTFFDENGVWGQKMYRETPQKSDFAGNSPFCHAGAMIRKDAFDAVGGYSEDENRLRVEDFDLWFRLYQAGFEGYNIPEPLYAMRDDRNAVSRKKFRYRINEFILKRRIAKEFKLGIAAEIGALRPLLLGLCPAFLYRILHRAKAASRR